jgi:hypothetical protein
MKCLQIPVPIDERMTTMGPTLFLPDHAAEKRLVKIKDFLGETTLRKS